MSDVLVPDSPAYVYLDRYTTDDSDSLAYDNETIRYDYDVVKGGPHDDVNGRGGVGYTTDDTDVYVSGHFDEANWECWRTCRFRARHFSRYDYRCTFRCR